VWYLKVRHMQLQVIMWFANDSTARASVVQRRRERAMVSTQEAGTRSWLREHMGRVWGDIRAVAVVPRCQRAVIALVFTGIFILDTERMVSLNLIMADEEWSYGQILALVATLPSVFEAITLVLDIAQDLVPSTKGTAQGTEEYRLLLGRPDADALRSGRSRLKRTLSSDDALDDCFE
jgi:hypothetical protein